MVNGESTGNDDDKAAELRGKQPKVAVKVATQRLKPLRGGEKDENDDVNDNENREAEQNINGK